MSDLGSSGETFSAGDILRRTFALLRRSPLRPAIALLILGGIGVAIDTGVAGTDGANFLNLVASAAALVAQYRLTRLLLQDLFGEQLAGAGFASFFGLNILSGSGILLGLVLLVIPGIVLFVRWSISVPILFATDEGVIGAMQRSARETQGRFWPIFVAYLALWLPAIGLAIVGTMLMAALPASLPGAIIFNLALNGALIAAWYAAVAIYSLVEQPAGLSDVFA